MTVFIIKSGICMVILFGLYWFILRKEKLFIFNRYYLILSVMFSVTVPFISIPVDVGHKKVADEIIKALNHKPGINIVKYEKETHYKLTPLPEAAKIYSVGQPAANESNPFNINRFILIIYLSGLILMLIRFCKNIFVVHKMLRESERINHDGYKIALIDNLINPFSFLRTIFLNKRDYFENKIPANVLRHELEHIRQSHSYDVIFFEIITIALWFNPILFLYKWAARINHEYLADDAVIGDSSDVETYAGELINFISCKFNISFTCGLSSSMIRNRLLMLNTKTTKWSKNIRMGITLFISVLLMISFSIRPLYPEAQSGSKRSQDAENDNIVIEEVYFRDLQFKPLKAHVVMDGKTLDIYDTVSVNPQQIKTINILKDRNAIRKYGRSAKYGAVEINTYKVNKGSLPDSMYFKTIYTVNNRIPEGSITIPVSNLYSISVWTYPIVPKQDLRKRWRTIDVVTRDFYRIRGKVVQNNGEPLPGVLVKITDNPSKAITDEAGRFLLEDVKSEAVAEISAEGYETLFFTVKGVVFRSDLTITLDKKNELGQNINWSDKNIKDFSGRWKFNKELSRTPVPVIDYIFDIQQYDSDSIMMHISRTFAKMKELNSNCRFVFNSVRMGESDMYNNTKTILTCSIAPDGQSFSVTYQSKSKLGLFKEGKRSEIYSLSEDENQMIIRTIDFPDVTSDTGKEIQVMVFDRNQVEI